MTRTKRPMRFSSQDKSASKKLVKIKDKSYELQ